MIGRAAALGITATLLSLCLPVKTIAPAIAQSSCAPLQVVGGEGSEVSKEVSPPTVPIPLPGPASTSLRSNWNTDWAVPGGQSFRSYIVTLTPQTTAEYNIRMYLKYADDTADKFYSEGAVNLTSGQPLTVTAYPRQGEQPYQVNVMVGSVNTIGHRYRVRVSGCR
jgi:hypothetical protein